MSGYNRILAPTDGSSGSDAAMREAVEIAERNDGKLFVIHVTDTSETILFPPESNREQLINSYEERAAELADQAADIAREADVEVTVDVVEGAPHETIVTYADENEIDLIAMGTHGRRGLERTLLGSTTEKTVRTANVPVIVVHD